MENFGRLYSFFRHFFCLLFLLLVRQFKNAFQFFFLSRSFFLFQLQGQKIKLYRIVLKSVFASFLEAFFNKLLHQEFKRIQDIKYLGRCSSDQWATTATGDADKKKIERIVKAHPTTPIYLVFDPPFISNKMISTRHMNFWHKNRLQKQSVFLKEISENGDIAFYATYYQKSFSRASRKELGKFWLETEFIWPSQAHFFINTLSQFSNPIAGFYEQNSWISSAVFAASFQRNSSVNWHVWVLKKETGICLLIAHKGVLFFMRPHIQEKNLTEEIESTFHYLKRFGLKVEETIILQNPFLNSVERETIEREALFKEPSSPTLLSEDVLLIAKVLAKELRARRLCGFFPNSLKPHYFVFQSVQFLKSLVCTILIGMPLIGGASCFLFSQGFSEKQKKDILEDHAFPDTDQSEEDQTFFSSLKPSLLLHDSLLASPAKIDPTEEAQLCCGGILYLHPEQWTVWINDRPIDSLHSNEPLPWEITEVTEGSVKIRIYDPMIHDITLHPGQSYAFQKSHANGC